MAELPDIDTTQASYLAYWNATNHGAQEIDPSEVLTHGNIVSHTLYDNGWEGTYEHNAGTYNTTVPFTVRVKNDGWFVAYYGRDSTYAQDTNGSFPVATFDAVVDKMRYHLDTSSSSPTPLGQCLNNLQGQLSNSGVITFDYADIGLYNYAHPASTTMTHLSGKVGSYTATTFGCSFTSSTSLDSWQTAVESGNVDFGGSNGIVWNGTNLTTEENRAASFDTLANMNLEPATEYTIQNDQNTPEEFKANHVIVWS